MRESSSQSVRPKRLMKKPKRYKSTTSENDEISVVKKLRKGSADSSLRNDIEDIHAELLLNGKKKAFSQLPSASISSEKTVSSKYKHTSERKGCSISSTISRNQSLDGPRKENLPSHNNKHESLPVDNKEDKNSHREKLSFSCTKETSIQTHTEIPTMTRNSFDPANTQGLERNFSLGLPHFANHLKTVAVCSRGEPYTPIPLKPSFHNSHVSPSADQSHFERMDPNKQSACDRLEDLEPTHFDFENNLTDAVGQAQTNLSSDFVPPKVMPRIIQTKIIVPGSSVSLQRSATVREKAVGNEEQANGYLNAKILGLHHAIENLGKRFSDDITNLRTSVADLRDEIRNEINPRAPRKPKFIPARRAADVTHLETMSDSNYRQLVQYLRYVGGITMRDAFNNSLKECLTDQCCMKYTYWGTQTCQSFYDKKIATAIYEAVAGNRHLPFPPTLAHFEQEMKECIRTAKQRYRNSLKVEDPARINENALKEKRQRARKMYGRIQSLNNKNRRDEEEAETEKDDGQGEEEHGDESEDEEERKDEEETEYEENE